MRRKILTVTGVCVLVLVVGCGVWVWAEGRGETRFCTMALSIVKLHDGEAVLQDQGPPGREGCDLDDTARQQRVLGRDCKVREPDGDVVLELEPNRDDGTCGLPDPGESFPESWSTG